MKHFFNPDTLGKHFLLLTLTGISLLFCTDVSAIEVHQKIRGPFASLTNVTEACLKCHHEKALEVLQSTHWTWIRQRTFNGKSTLFDKKESLTNFAIDVSSNPTRCMTCHISTSRPRVDLKNPTPNQVDCLVCHDTTGLYKRYGINTLNTEGSEHLLKMARNVGKSGVRNCTTCHFRDCELPEQDFPAAKSIVHDFHLENAETIFTCQSCHTMHNGHGFSRKISTGESPSLEQGCASCHSSAPHALAQLNEHFEKIACQTCHIPEYARQVPVGTNWNWIIAGTEDDNPQDSIINQSPVFKLNGFITSMHLNPVYLWDDGSDQIYTRGQRIQPDEITYLQRPTRKRSGAKITPFRTTYGTQLYDAKYRYLISPLLEENTTSFFAGSNWKHIAQKGMDAVVLPFSGQYAFTSTVLFKRINHGIVPAHEALGCIDCHGANSLMPWKDLGYDTDPWLENQDQGKKDQTQRPSNSNRSLLQNFNQLSRR